MKPRNVIKEENRWNYEVGVRDLKTVDKNGQILERQKATVDDSTGEILGIVSPYYKLVQNKTLFDVMQDIGKNLDLNLQNIFVCKNRSVTIFRYAFSDKKNITIENSQEKNDIISFGVELINSFDSRWGSSKFRAFAERLVCLNGMTLPKDIASFSFSSLKTGFDGNIIERELTTRITPIIETANIWNKWAEVFPDRIKVGEFISGNLGKEASKVILEKYDNGKDKTIWGLYNLLTYYISHEIISENLENLRFKQYTLERICDKFYDIDRGF